jgi:hypothetical protein
MKSMSGKRYANRCGAWVLRTFAALLVVWGCMGASCDSEAAAVFRSTATSEIGEGVRTIMNGVLDGLIAAVEEAGDGPGGS